MAAAAGVGSLDDLHSLLRLARQYKARLGRNNWTWGEEHQRKASYYYRQIIDQAADDTDKILSSALYELSSIHQFDFDTSYAYDLIVEAANLGHPDATHLLSTIYSTGVYNGLYSMDAGRALMLEYMAALAENPTANMGMGYRYLNGIGVPESCETALRHYEFVANIVANNLEQNIFSTHIDKPHLNELDSAKSKGRRELDNEVIDYYIHLAAEDDFNAALSLGSMYLHGSRYAEKDIEKAIKYINIPASLSHTSASGQLAYILALLYNKDPNSNIFNVVLAADEIITDKIKSLASFSSKRGDTFGILTQGYLFYKGIGEERNYSKSLDYFKKVLTKHQDAGYYMGEMLMGEDIVALQNAGFSQVSMHDAALYYSTASQKGNVLAIHRLSHMAANGFGVAKSCETAVNGFRVVAEKGEWMDDLTYAASLYELNYIPQALMIYAQYAAIGVEAAQFNAAFLLSKYQCPSNIKSRNTSVLFNSDEVKRDKDLGVYVTELGINDKILVMASFLNETYANSSGFKTTKSDCELRALSLYGLSASQGAAESYLRIGDFYYYGQAGMDIDKKEAAKYYQLSADLQHTQAVFNLGIMYESGDGVNQDFHLAKRYYDQAAIHDPDAKLPRQLALFLLSSHKTIQDNLGIAITFDQMRELIASMLPPFITDAFTYAVNFVDENVVQQFNSEIEQAGVYIRKLRQQITSMIVQETILFDQTENSPTDSVRSKSLPQLFMELDQDVLADISLLVALLAALIYVQGLRAMRRRRRDGIIHNN